MLTAVCSANEDRDSHPPWSSRRGYVFLGVCFNLDFEEPISVKGCGRCKTSEDVTPKPVVSERTFAALPGLCGFLRPRGQGNRAVPSYPVFLLGDAGEASLHLMWRKLFLFKNADGPPRPGGPPASWCFTVSCCIPADFGGDFQLRLKASSSDFCTLLRTELLVFEPTSRGACCLQSVLQHGL